MRAGTALLLVLAVAACARFGLDPFGPTSPDLLAADEAETAELAAPSGTNLPPLPLPRPRRDGEDAATGPIDQAAAAAAAENSGSAPATAAPHVYMALQPDSGSVTSVVFAIDASRDNTPSDDPAIRITPEATESQSGRCNAQQLRYYRFPPERAGAPVYGPAEASRGVGARDLPEFLATAVSAEMMARGIAEDLEATRPQNVCTRKLFEQTIIAASTGQG